MECSAEVEEAVNAYLTEVEGHLRGASAGQKRELLDDLRTHIREGLEQAAVVAGACAVLTCSTARMLACSTIPAVRREWSGRLALV